LRSNFELKNSASTSRKNTFPRKEHLKSSKAISELFTKNKQVKAYPLMAVYDSTIALENHPSLRVGFSVPKKKIPKAVNRNLIKRRMIEAFRLNTSGLKTSLEKQNQYLSAMFVYTSADISNYGIIESKMKDLIKSLTDAVS